MNSGAKSLKLTGILAMSIGMAALLQANGSPALGASLDPSRFQELSGKWKGSTQTSQVGSCAYRGRVGATTSSAMDGRVKGDASTFEISVDASGKLELTELFADGPNPDTRWVGQIAPDGSIHATRTMVVDCNGVSTPAQGEFIGSLRIKNDVPSIKLTGTEAWCPNGCKFQLKVVIKRTGGVEANGRPPR
jgi:hypothetical protein